jgi:hypothetical protein
MERYKIFYTLDDLLERVREDKNWDSAESAMLNRYPLRFILFESFNDFNEFVQNRGENVYVQSVDKWLDDDSPDTLITYSQLAVRIKEYVKRLPANDFVIAPFSEMARFYDNTRHTEFDSLITTIRLAQSPQDSQLNHQRLYIPIIGMLAKMGRFANDPNIHIWEYKSNQEVNSYELILTRGNIYGIQGIANKYTVATTLRDWLKLWQHGEQITQKIICSSKAIFDNAHNAQPDNAFHYVICNNVYEFLTNGLGLDFGDIKFKSEDIEHWETLAKSIDISDFSFDDFVNQHFDTFGLVDSLNFIKTWFACDTSFDRWLLSIYYQKKFDNSDYLWRVLQLCDKLNTAELFSNLATVIFDENITDKTIGERKLMLTEASRYNKVTITELAEQKVRTKLCAIAADPERGYYYATKLLTSLTQAEKQLMIEWVGADKMDLSSLKSLYPALYGYLQPFAVQTDVPWVNDYFVSYRKAKIANTITPEILDHIAQLNGNPVKFQDWYDEFKTVKTILNNRHDIEVVYWIDGLGMDWLPFISSVIGNHSHDGIYLNEIHIAVAELPTRTENNKTKLQELVNGELKKIGDIDTYAHSHKEYPAYIIEEMRIVEDALNDVITKYNGKKIAFVSDHGITYLSQLSHGLNLAGLESDHAGRVAVRSGSSNVDDEKCIIIEDGKTHCALTHASLCAKVPKGQGSHGGATPEEVLVPIIVVSNQKNANNFTVKLLSDEIVGTNPVVRLSIKGLTTADCPTLSYNGVNYLLNKSAHNTYESERLNLVDTCNRITIYIGESFCQTETISVNTGVEENDPFDF